jgi:NADH-quinone oxidoreductase subunit I
MRIWLRNVTTAVSTIARSMYVTLHTFVQSYIRRPFTAYFQYPERPAPIRPRYRGFHRFDLTTCIGCDKCARACPVDCIYIEKEKAPPPLKGFVITGFKIDYTKCMFCALCVDPCPVDCLFMSSTYDLSTYSRDGCIVDFAKLPREVAWGQDTLNPTAVLESKRITLPVWTKVPAAPTEAAAPSTAAGSATAAPSSVSGSGG